MLGTVSADGPRRQLGRFKTSLRPGGGPARASSPSGLEKQTRDGVGQEGPRRGVVGHKQNPGPEATLILGVAINAK